MLRAVFACSCKFEYYVLYCRLKVEAGSIKRGCGCVLISLSHHMDRISIDSKEHSTSNRHLVRFLSFLSTLLYLHIAGKFALKLH